MRLWQMLCMWLLFFPTAVVRTPDLNAKFILITWTRTGNLAKDSKFVLYTFTLKGGLFKFQISLKNKCRLCFFLSSAHLGSRNNSFHHFLSQEAGAVVVMLQMRKCVSSFHKQNVCLSSLPQHGTPLMPFCSREPCSHPAWRPDCGKNIPNL